MMTILESKLAQTHVALTGPTRQQVLQLIMTILESKLARIHVALTGPWTFSKLTRKNGIIWILLIVLTKLKQID